LLFPSFSTQCFRFMKSISEPYIALVDGDSDREGRVEFYHKGEWGTLGAPLSHVEASYICRELGYLGGEATEPGYFGAGDLFSLYFITIDRSFQMESILFSTRFERRDREAMYIYTYKQSAKKGKIWNRFITSFL